MFHHDQRDYNEAASAAAARGRVRMEEIIHNGMVSAEAVVAEIQGQTVIDKVAPAPRIKILPREGGGFDLGVVALSPAGYTYSDEDVFPLHPHAYGQILANSGLGKRFADGLLEDAGKEPAWAEELIAHNVNTVFAHRPKQRNLIRIDENGGSRVKGFLSDAFRRLDSRPLVDAFMGACKDEGLVPLEGVSTETKCRVRAIKPIVFEPMDNEIIVFGVEIGNSNYGDGGLVVNLTAMRVWCTNMAVTEKGIRKVHLGGRLPDDLRLSEETYRLDAQATASAVTDITKELIGPDRINRMLAAFQGASQKVIRSSDGIDNMLRGLDKPEIMSVKTLYEGNDVVNLPAGDTVYRLSNAVSWFAQSKGVSADRKLALQETAGRLLVPDTKQLAGEDV